MLLPDSTWPAVRNRTLRGGMTRKTERAGTAGGIDRRVARTRALLQDALIALIPERGYAAITVEDICNKADVGRSTFYTHYVSKDELRNATIDTHLRSLNHKRLSASQAADGRLFTFSLPMFEHAHAFRSLHHALLSGSGDSIHDELRERIQGVVRAELVERSIANTEIPVEFAVQFIAGAFLSVLGWWTAADTGLTPTQADAFFQTMLRQAVVAGRN